MVLPYNFDISSSSWVICEKARKKKSQKWPLSSSLAPLRGARSPPTRRGTLSRCSVTRAHQRAAVCLEFNFYIFSSRRLNKSDPLREMHAIKHKWFIPIDKKLLWLGAIFAWVCPVPLSPWPPPFPERAYIFLLCSMSYKNNSKVLSFKEERTHSSSSLQGRKKRGASEFSLLHAHTPKAFFGFSIDIEGKHSALKTTVFYTLSSEKRLKSKLFQTLNSEWEFWIEFQLKFWINFELKLAVCL